MQRGQTPERPQEAHRALPGLEPGILTQHLTSPSPREVRTCVPRTQARNGTQVRSSAGPGSRCCLPGSGVGGRGCVVLETPHRPPPGLSPKAGCHCCHRRGPCWQAPVPTGVVGPSQAELTFRSWKTINQSVCRGLLSPSVTLSPAASSVQFALGSWPSVIPLCSRKLLEPSSLSDGSHLAFPDCESVSLTAPGARCCRRRAGAAGPAPTPGDRRPESCSGVAGRPGWSPCPTRHAGAAQPQEWEHSPPTAQASLREQQCSEGLCSLAWPGWAPCDSDFSDRRFQKTQADAALGGAFLLGQRAVLQAAHPLSACPLFRDLACGGGGSLQHPPRPALAPDHCPWRLQAGRRRGLRG